MQICSNLTYSEGKVDDMRKKGAEALIFFFIYLFYFFFGNLRII